MNLNLLLFLYIKIVKNRIYTPYVTMYTPETNN